MSAAESPEAADARGAAVRFRALEEAIEEAGRRRARVPAEAQHRQVNRLAAELQRLVAAPHVDVDLAPLDRRAGVQHGVDAVVLRRQRIDLDDGADRQQLRGRRRRRRSAPRRRTPSCMPLQYAVALNARRAPGAGSAVVSRSVAWRATYFESSVVTS